MFVTLVIDLEDHRLVYDKPGLGFEDGALGYAEVVVVLGGEFVEAEYEVGLYAVEEKVYAFGYREDRLDYEWELLLGLDRQAQEMWLNFGDVVAAAICIISGSTCQDQITAFLTIPIVIRTSKSKIMSKRRQIVHLSNISESMIKLLYDINLIMMNQHDIHNLIIVSHTHHDSKITVVIGIGIAMQNRNICQPALLQQLIIIPRYLTVRLQLISTENSQLLTYLPIEPTTQAETLAVVTSSPKTFDHLICFIDIKGYLIICQDQYLTRHFTIKAQQINLLQLIMQGLIRKTIPQLQIINFQSSLQLILDDQTQEKILFVMFQPFYISYRAIRQVVVNDVRGVHVDTLLGYDQMDYGNCSFHGVENSSVYVALLVMVIHAAKNLIIHISLFLMLTIFIAVRLLFDNVISKLLPLIRPPTAEPAKMIQNPYKIR